MDSAELKYARDKSGYRQKDVAARLGLSNATYCRKENGVQEFKAEEKIRLAQILGMTASQVNDFLFQNELPVAQVIELSREQMQSYLDSEVLSTTTIRDIAANTSKDALMLKGFENEPGENPTEIFLAIKLPI